MHKNDCINFIESSLNNGKLPGMNAMAQMAPVNRKLDYPVKNNYSDSAVAILLFEQDGELFFPLIKRTSHNKNDKHRGQISLPGGKFDQEDKTLLNCAMRELEEELGVDKANISTLGELTKLFIPVSNFMVQPFVFYSAKYNHFTAQESEVEYILEIQLRDLLDDNNVKKGEIELISGRKINDIPYFNLNNHIIWGATAMILNEFKNVAISYKTN